MRSVFALTIAAFAGFTAAQTDTTQDYPYTIDPDSVDDATRSYWCDQNKAQCPLICLQQPGVDSMTTQDNDCDPDALTYTCICDNGISPNITQYSQTLPFFICQQWGQNCVKACPSNDNTCQDACISDHPCGAQDPFRGNASLSTTMSSTSAPTGSATNDVSATGSDGAAETASNWNEEGAGSVFMPNAGLGLAALFSSVFLAFAVLL